MQSKREIFAAEYVVDQNATKAAIRAGYSKATAYSQGSRLLKVIEVRTEIDRQQSRHAERVDVQVDEVVAGLRTIAEDCLAPAAARVSAWKALGDYKGMFSTGVREECSYLLRGVVNRSEENSHRHGDSMPMTAKIA